MTKRIRLRSVRGTGRPRLVLLMQGDEEPSQPSSGVILPPRPKRHYESALEMLVMGFSLGALIGYGLCVAFGTR